MSRPLGIMVLDEMTAVKMWPFWLSVFLIWLGLSVSSLITEGPTNTDVWWVIYITAWIGIPAGILGFHMLWHWLIKRERKQHKLRHTSRS